MKLFISIILLSCVWFWVDGKTYYLNTNQKVNWYEAFQSCAKQGKQLATISNEAENNQLKKQISDAHLATEFLWISLTDAATEGTFVWFSTGCNATYSDFDPAPNNYNGDEDCVHMWTSTGYQNRQAWNDLNCNTAIYYVCEDKTCGKCGEEGNNNNNNGNTGTSTCIPNPCGNPTCGSPGLLTNLIGKLL